MLCILVLYVVSYTILLLTMMTCLLFIPWQFRYSVPATLSYDSKTLYSPFPSKVGAVLVKEGQYVSKGQKLLVLHSEKLEFEIKIAYQKLNQLKWKKRNNVHFQNYLETSKVIESQIKYQQEKLDQLYKERKKMVFYSPFNGIVKHLSSDLHKNSWLKDNKPLMFIVNKNKLDIQAYINSENNHKLKLGDIGSFIPENLDIQKFPVKVKNIIKSKVSVFSGDNLNNRANVNNSRGIYNSSKYGGDVIVNIDNNGKLIPQDNQF